jgi:hypothetical protein
MFTLVWLIPAITMRHDLRSPKENKMSIPLRNQNMEVITGDGVIPT